MNWFWSGPFAKLRLIVNCPPCIHRENFGGGTWLNQTPRNLPVLWHLLIKIECIIIFKISKIRPKSLLGPVNLKAQKFLRCLLNCPSLTTINQLSCQKLIGVGGIFSPLFHVWNSNHAASVFDQPVRARYWLSVVILINFLPLLLQCCM